MTEPGYFVIPKKALEEAMKLLDAIPSRSGIISSEFIKTELKDSKHLRMSLSSELSGEALVPVASKKHFETVLYLDRRMLKPFIQAGVELNASDMYEFTVVENMVTVKNGVRVAKLESNKSATGYEKMPELKDSFSIELQEEWTSIAICATLCACTDPIAPALNCVHLSPEGGKVYVRASDTKLVFQGVLPATSFPCTEAIALPLDIIVMLNLFSTGICYYSSKWAMLKFPVGNVWQAVKVECRKAFPVDSISAVVKNIAKNGILVGSIGSQSLVEATDRIADYMQSAMRDNPVLQLAIKSGSKKARLSSKTIGAAFDETISLEDKAEREYVVEWPLQAILPIMQYCKNSGSAKVIQDESGKSCLKAGRVTLVVGAKQKTKKRGK